MDGQEGAGSLALPPYKLVLVDGQSAPGGFGRERGSAIPGRFSSATIFSFESLPGSSARAGALQTFLWAAPKRKKAVTYPRAAGSSCNHQACPVAAVIAYEEINTSSGPRPSSAKRCAAPGKPLAPATSAAVNRRFTSTVESATEQRSDHALMLAVRHGELDALGELFERHHGPLYGFLVKLTGNRTGAEDVAQTVFQRMLKYRHTYRDDGSFTAWMYHLARRCAADHFRRANAAPQPTDPAILRDHPDDTPHAAQHATTRDDHALLHRALGRLDHNDREILLLSRFQELSFAEISHILECSVGAAKVRAHRALQELRVIYLRLQKEPAS